MKWYNYKDKWVNIECLVAIELFQERQVLFYAIGQSDSFKIFYDDYKERDAEFEKIKALMGVIQTYPADMVPFDKWTPGRCC